LAIGYYFSGYLFCIDYDTDDIMAYYLLTIGWLLTIIYYFIISLGPGYFQYLMTVTGYWLLTVLLFDGYLLLNCYFGYY
jgi:hypothetical protein